MAKGHGKGSSFEREICKQLSLWWTYGKSNDIFWRTAGSGAMAKTRSKTGNRAFGQYGDIQATDPQGQRLIDLCSIELKRGYSKNTFADVIDKANNAAQQIFESFIEQAVLDSYNSNARTWMLITKRDRREALVFIPYDFYKKLKNITSLIRGTYVCLHFEGIDARDYKIFGIPLTEFLETVKPSYIKKLASEWRAEKRLNTEKIVVDNLAADEKSKCILCEEEEAVRYDKMKKIWVCSVCGNEFYDKP